MPALLDQAAAAALIDGSRLFDEQWYAATAGAAFGSRAEAIEHWLTQWDGQASPHPLFEPSWLYPGGRWRGRAPDPLSFYLSKPGRRAPHPRYDVETLGEVEAWLAAHDPSELLPEPSPRAPVGEVSVVVPAEPVGTAVAWARHLARVAPEVTGVLTGAGPAAARVLGSVVADLPTVRVDDEVISPVRVDVATRIRPPRWPWLPPLLDALDRPGVDAACALLLAEDFTVAGPVLAGLPLADAERVDGLPVPAEGVVARRTASGTAPDEAVLVSHSRLLVPQVSPADRGNLATWRAAGFESPGVPIRVREGRPALRWSIDIAAGAGPIGTRWGDYHFARSLAAALDRLGQWVALDHPETRGRASRELDDVVLVIRGLEPVTPPAHLTSLLWVISHPDDVTRDEVAAYDAAFAASRTWAAARSAEWGLPVEPLLQCTDTTRFHPGLAEPDSGPRRLFVGNARHQLRPSVAAAIETRTPLTVIGTGWDEWLPVDDVRVEADRVANEDLPALYASAGLVLNDHWEDMRVEGFVSNRIFDVLATGARLLTDEVAGLADVLGHGLTTWSDHDEFARLTAEPLEAHYPDEPHRRALADEVVAEHSFDARAATLLETALRLRAG